MKKRILLIALAVILSFSFGGCKSSIPDLSDEEMDQVKEYAVKLLLKYDAGHKQSMVSDEEESKALQSAMDKAEIEAKAKAAKEEAAKKKEQDAKDKEGQQGESDVSKPVDIDIDEFIENNSVDIEYSGMTVADAYPETTGENDFQGVVHAGNGNKLVVLFFDVTNKSASDYYFDVPSYNLKVAFKINGSKTKVPLTTLLIDDFFNFRDNVATGETKKLVLLIELSENDCASISSFEMNVKYNGQKGTKKIL